MTMRQRLAHIALGGVLVLSGMIASSLLQTSDAQQPASNIVKAREFHLVNALGSTTAVIASGPDGLVIQNAFRERNGRVSVVVDEFGSYMYFYNAAGKPVASISANLEWGGGLLISAAKGNGSVSLGQNDAKNGGLVNVLGANGSAQISVDEHGGMVDIFGKGSDRPKAVMGVNEYGNGGVSVRGVNGSAQIVVNEHGGAVSVFGKGSDRSKAVMSVNEYGNGGVSTWDKNGYRQR